MPNRFFFFIFLNFALLWSAEPEFTISGNFFFDEDEIIAQTGLGEEYSLVPENRQSFLLGIAEQNLKELYFNKGFFNASFNLKRTETNTTQNTVAVEVNEGPRFSFNSIEIRQPTWSPFYNHHFDLSAKSGFKYNQEGLTQDIETIKKTFREAGYFYVSLRQTMQIDTAKHYVDILYQITPGTRIVMGKLNIQLIRAKSYATEGGEPGKSDSAYVASLWDLEKGSIVPASALSDFRKKLLFTNMFNRVQISDSLSAEDDQLRDIYVIAQEKVPGSVGASIFYEDLIGTGVGGSLRYKNFGGHFHQMSTEGVLAERRQRLGLGYAHPLFFGYNIKADDRIIYNQEQLPLPENPDSLENTREVINLGQLSFSISEHVKFNGLTDLRYVDGVNRKVRFKYEPSVYFEYLDNTLEPRAGLRLRYAIGQGGPFDWPDRYIYHKAESKFYVPLSESSTWAFALDYGSFFSQSLVEDARLFYLGGFRSVRGYDPRSLFPEKLDADGEILTGLTPQFVRLSNEIRFDLPENWIENFQWVQFSDFGWIWDQDKTYKESRRAALGMGIRYKLSLLTLRLDYSFKKHFDNPFSFEPFEWSRFSLDLSQAI